MKFLVKDWVLYWRSFAADSARRKRLLKKVSSNCSSYVIVSYRGFQAYNNWVVRCVALAFSAWKRKTEEMVTVLSKDPALNDLTILDCTGCTAIAF